MKVCKKCKTMTEDAALYCSNCGGSDFESQKTKRCPFCAQEVAELTIVCPNCHRILPPDCATSTRVVKVAPVQVEETTKNQPMAVATDRNAEINNFARKGYDVNATVADERAIEANDKNAEEEPKAIDREEFLFGFDEAMNAGAITRNEPAAKNDTERRVDFTPIERNVPRAESAERTGEEFDDLTAVAKREKEKEKVKKEKESTEKARTEIVNKPRKEFKIVEKPYKQKGIFGIIFAILVAAIGVVGSIIHFAVSFGGYQFSCIEIAVSSLPEQIASLFPTNYKLIISLFAGLQKTLLAYTSAALTASYAFILIAVILILFAFGRKHGTLSMAVLFGVCATLCSAFTVYATANAGAAFSYGLFALAGGELLFTIISTIVYFVKKSS